MTPGAMLEHCELGSCGLLERPLRPRYGGRAENWLRAQPDQPTTIAELQALIDRFRTECNTTRPHRSLPHRAIPAALYDTIPKAPAEIRSAGTHATRRAAEGLSPRSIRKDHTMLHSIFKRAVRDQLIVTNPCEHTELPKIIARKTTLTPTEYGLLLGAIPDPYQLLVETPIETGMRWGELVALRPRHIDFLRRSVTVEETIIEVS
jgi:integrase